MKMLAEMQGVSPEAKRLLDDISGVIHGLLPTATILLYGSVARGMPRSESDYDILVLTDSPLSRAEEDTVMDAVFDLELERKAVISTLFYARDEWDMPVRRVSPFHQEVERDAIVL